MNPQTITNELIADLQKLRFGKPVIHVYNPLLYARQAYETYWRRFDGPAKEVLLVGMNPGPWGMAQTGVPFGDVTMVREWLGIEVEVGSPGEEHPKRLVHGFQCRRKEVSGQRLWGWARDTFGSPEQFFQRFFVINYCPLLFIEESGRNRTPDGLPVAERRPLLAACDLALRRKVEWLQPRWVVGVGRFAEARVREVLADGPWRLGGITHPSPANPRANRDWQSCIREEFAALGITY